MIRQTIITIIGILIIIGAYFGSETIVANKKKGHPKASRVLATAYVKEVKNDTIPVKLTETGRLVAKRKANLYAEVQGVMKPQSKEFKPGSLFKKGDLLIKIQNEGFNASLQAQKSVLQNLITSVLPDLRLDFPESFEAWNQYLKDFDINKETPLLPEPKSEKEKFFLTGKNLFTTYYNTKNLEATYRKYFLRAPFDGVLTEAFVNPGTVIRPGQQLGEFIDPTVFELEVALSESLTSYVRVGHEVLVYSPENPAKQWVGKVSRVNGKVNPDTRTIDTFVNLKGPELKEGMFLEALLSGAHHAHAIELDRKLLVNDRQLFIVTDSILQLSPINVLHKNKSTVIVGGLPDGVQLLTRTIPGAYEGMKVIVEPISVQ